MQIAASVGGRVPLAYSRTGTTGTPTGHPHTGLVYKKASKKKKISSIVSVLGVGGPMMQEVKLLPLLLLSSCHAHAPAPRRTPTRRFVPQGNSANPTRPLVMLPMAYGAASAQMAAMAMWQHQQRGPCWRRLRSRLLSISDRLRLEISPSAWKPRESIGTPTWRTKM